MLIIYNNLPVKIFEQTTILMYLQKFFGGNYHVKIELFKNEFFDFLQCTNLIIFSFF